MMMETNKCNPGETNGEESLETSQWTSEGRIISNPSDSERSALPFINRGSHFHPSTLYFLKLRFTRLTLLRLVKQLSDRNCKVNKINTDKKQHLYYKNKNQKQKAEM